MRLRLTWALDRADRDVVGVDLSPVMIERARGAGRSPRVSFVQGDFLSLDLGDGFDCVVSAAALHHLDEDAAVARLAGLVRPGGRLIIQDRTHVESMQITMAEDFGIQDGGAFYDATGAVRDVIQNHLFQVLSNLAMEPPARMDSESLRDEKVKVLKSIPALEAGDIVRGQFRNCRVERGVAADSQVETYAAVRLHIDSWRWQGVPFHIRTGKCLPLTPTEVVIRLRRPPTVFPSAAPLSNYCRFPDPSEADDCVRGHGDGRGRPAGRPAGRTRGEPTARG